MSIWYGIVGVILSVLEWPQSHVTANVTAMLRKILRGIIL
jgi:hypothetical protein